MRLDNNQKRRQVSDTPIWYVAYVYCLTTRSLALAGANEMLLSKAGVYETTQILNYSHYYPIIQTIKPNLKIVNL